MNKFEFEWSRPVFIRMGAIFNSAGTMVEAKLQYIMCYEGCNLEDTHLKQNSRVVRVKAERERAESDNIKLTFGNTREYNYNENKTILSVNCHAVISHNATLIHISFCKTCEILNTVGLERIES